MSDLLYLLLAIIVVVWVLVLYKAAASENRYDVSGDHEEID